MKLQLRAAGLLCAALLLGVWVDETAGHGYLNVPRSRNRRATDLGQDYCPHCKNAGGGGAVSGADPTPGWQYPETVASSVRHGLCGDPANGAQTLMYGGSYYNGGQIEATYTAGQSFEAQVWIDTHHHGWFEFYLCENPSGAITQSCLNQHRLDRDPNYNTESPINPAYPGRFFMYPKCHSSLNGSGQGYMYIGLKLPAGVTCEHCVLQWWWVTANNCHGGGYDGVTFPNTYQDCIGDGQATGWLPRPNSACADGGYPEEFWNCADIRIISGSPTPPTTAPPTPLVTQAPTPPPNTPTNPPVTPTNPPSTGGSCQTTWQQCGGIGWSGSTTCCTDTCTRLNDYYYQCLP